MYIYYAMLYEFNMSYTPREKGKNGTTLRIKKKDLWLGKRIRIHARGFYSFKSIKDLWDLAGKKFLLNYYIKL